MHVSSIIFEATLEFLTFPRILLSTFYANMSLFYLSE